MVISGKHPGRLRRTRICKRCGAKFVTKRRTQRLCLDCNNSSRWRWHKDELGEVIDG